MAILQWLGPLSTDSTKLKREAVKRRKAYEQMSVPRGALQEYLDDGWDFDKELIKRTRIRREIAPERRLEDRVWMLFYLLGYPELSSGRNFSITIQRKNAQPITKQVDVFAKDQDTVVVAECKYSASVTRRSLQKDIEELASLKGSMAHAIKTHYGRNYKPKIVWLFVTENIYWSEPDRQRAAGANIQVVTEQELSYYSQIADHLRTAARYQFLAEFLKNDKIPEMENTVVPAIRGRLGGKSFYSFVSTPRQLLKIAFVNHRSLNDPTGAPTYQRLVSRTRLREIARFLDGGGFFPTNILLNFTRSCRFDMVSKDEATSVVFGHLYLPSRYRSAWVIDGQHRLYGYAALPEKHLDENVLVVAFEKLRTEEEANLFVTINGNNILVKSRMRGVG